MLKMHASLQMQASIISKFPDKIETILIDSLILKTMLQLLFFRSLYMSRLTSSFRSIDLYDAKLFKSGSRNVFLSFFFWYVCRTIVLLVLMYEADAKFMLFM